MMQSAILLVNSCCALGGIAHPVSFVSMPAGVCSLHGTDGAPEGACVQVDLGCHALDYAKEGKPHMSNGTCASIGFGVAGNSSTETSPWTGDIVITTYTRAVNLALDSICSLHGTDGAPEGACVQWDLDCHAVKYAKECEPRMSDGTCVSIGFGVAGNSSTETSPWTGDIVITPYTRAVNMSADRICSLHGTDGAPEGCCVQWDLGCHAVEYAKEGEPRMSDGTCASLGFGVAGNSSTETSPWTGDIVITTYTAVSLHDDFDALSNTVMV